MLEECSVQIMLYLWLVELYSFFSARLAKFWPNKSVYLSDLYLLDFSGFWYELRYIWEPLCLTILKLYVGHKWQTAVMSDETMCYREHCNVKV